MPLRRHRLPSLIARFVLLSLAAVSLAVLRPARRPGARADQIRAPKRRSGVRRVAVSLTFATLFFAGAAFSAGAGDLLVEAVEDQHAAASAPAADASSESSDGECSDLRRSDWDAEDCTEPASEPATEASADQAAAEDSSLSNAVQEAAEALPEAASPEKATPSTTAAIAAAAGNVIQSGNSDARAGDSPSSQAPSLSNAVRQRAKRSRPRETGPPVIAPQPRRASYAKADAEAEVPGMASTIWLHRALPDPTPASRRLTRPFARSLRYASAKHHVHWSIVLGVLRARGDRGSAPATRKGLDRLARNLSRLNVRQDEWNAALALEGRTAFADRAVALARYHRAVGLNALVRGLEWAKPMLTRKLLADQRVSIYPGGRADLKAGRVNVRVVVLIRYMAEAHGQVTVSCLEAGHALYSRPGVISRHIYGLAVDFSALEGKSIAGNQEPGGVTEMAVRNILLLPAELRPLQVISLLGLGGPSFPLANHDDHIHAGF